MPKIYPHLAGQNAAYLVKQLKAFRMAAARSLMVPFMAARTERTWRTWQPITPA